MTRFEQGLGGTLAAGTTGVASLAQDRMVIEIEPIAVRGAAVSAIAVTDRA